MQTTPEDHRTILRYWPLLAQLAVVVWGASAIYTEVKSVSTQVLSLQQNQYTMRDAARDQATISEKLTMINNRVTLLESHTYVAQPKPRRDTK